MTQAGTENLRAYLIYAIDEVYKLGVKDWRTFHSHVTQHYVKSDYDWWSGFASTFEADYGANIEWLAPGFREQVVDYYLDKTFGRNAHSAANSAAQPDAHSAAQPTEAPHEARREAGAGPRREAQRLRDEYRDEPVQREPQPSAQYHHRDDEDNRATITSDGLILDPSGHPADGDWAFAITDDDHLLLFDSTPGHAAAGTTVVAAGTMELSSGRLTSFSTDSGGYQPSLSAPANVLTWLRNHGVSIG